MSWVEVQRDTIFDLPTVTVPEVPLLGMRPTALQVTGTSIEENYGAGTTEAEVKDFRSRAEYGAGPGSMEETSIWAILQVFAVSTKPVHSYEREEKRGGGKERGREEGKERGRRESKSQE